MQPHILTQFETIAETMIDHLSIPACVIDRNFHMVKSNLAFYHLADITTDYLYESITLNKCIDVDLFSLDFNLAGKLVDQKESMKLIPVKCRDSKGKAQSLSLSAVPLSLFNPDSELLMLLFQPTSISEEMTVKYPILYDGGVREWKRNQEAQSQLTSVVDEKVSQLAVTLKNLEKTYETLQSEIEIAQKVQRGLFPQLLPNYANLDIAGVFIPTDKVSGDMYDIIIKKDNKTAIFIFDVSGHGISSALIGVMAKMLFVQYIKTQERPSEIFNRVNSDICHYLKTGHFITAFLGIIDHTENSMIYSQAGHVLPVFYTHEQKKVSFIEGNSVFLGHVALSDIAEYHDDIISFAWNDKLILYTDGLTEAMNENNDLYGKQRLAKLVKKHGHRNPADLVNKIVEDNNLFRNGRKLNDDFAMVCIQFGCSEDILKISGFSREDNPEMVTFNTHEEIEPICSVVMRKLDHKGYTNRTIYQTHQCLHEMLDNAIVHGNKFNSNKKVIVLYKIQLNAFSISVIDEGSGYDHSVPPQALLDQDITKSHGKGLYIISHFMDEVLFNDTGNRIMIKKYVHPETHDGDRNMHSS